MLVIRLQRNGRKNRAEYRVVVAEKSRAVQKRAVEILGHYLPQRSPKILEVNTERVNHWLSMGACPSETVASLFKGLGFKNMEKFMSAPKKKRPVKNPAAEPEAPAAPVAEEAVSEAPAEEPASEAPAPEETPTPAEEPASE